MSERLVFGLYKAAPHYMLQLLMRLPFIQYKASTRKTLSLYNLED